MRSIKKICFFISDISKIGGTERVCTEVANRLFIEGFQVQVLSMYNAKPFFKLLPGIKVASVLAKRVNRFLIPYTVWEIRKKFEVIKPDIVIDVDSALFLYTRIATIKMQLKIVIWEHFNFKFANQSLARRVSRKMALKYGDAIVTLTEKDREVWRKYAPNKHIVSIPNPSPLAPSRINEHERKQIVLSVGRLTAQKGFDILLNVWAKVNQHVSSGWMLYIIGSGEWKNRLESQIQKARLQASVKLIPATGEIENYYRQAAIYCMTSRFEGFPMALLEAQSFGLPLLSFDCETGPSEIITSGYNGLLVKNGDVDAMASELTMLIERAEIRTNFGTNAKKNAEQYQIDHIIKLWFKLFSLLAENGRLK